MNSRWSDRNGIAGQKRSDVNIHTYGKDREHLKPNTTLPRQHSNTQAENGSGHLEKVLSNATADKPTVSVAWPMGCSSSNNAEGLGYNGM